MSDEYKPYVDGWRFVLEEYLLGRFHFVPDAEWDDRPPKGLESIQGDKDKHAPRVVGVGAPEFSCATYTSFAGSSAGIAVSFSIDVTDSDSGEDSSGVDLVHAQMAPRYSHSPGKGTTGAIFPPGKPDTWEPTEAQRQASKSGSAGNRFVVIFPCSVAQEKREIFLSVFMHDGEDNMAFEIIKFVVPEEILEACCTEK